jgi:hypothetical protein
MLAGAEAVDAVIGATARIQPFGQAAELDLVGATGGGANAEGAEVGAGRFQRLDAEDLGLAAPPSALDFVLVVGEPACSGGARSSTRLARVCFLARRLVLLGWGRSGWVACWLGEKVPKVAFLYDWGATRWRLCIVPSARQRPQDVGWGVA